MANIYDVEGIEEFLPEQKKPLSSFLGDYATTANEVAAPYIGMAGKYGFGNDPAKIQGLGSDVRHTTGSALGKFGIQDYFSQFGLQPSNPISNFLGNAGIMGSTAVQEISDAIRGFRQAGLEGAINQPMEDVKANFRAMGIPYGTSLEDIVNMSVEGSPSAYMANAPEEVKISRFNAPGPFNYGTAEAAEVTPQNKPMDIEDFLGTSTPQNLGFIDDAPQIKEAIYQDRIMNPNLPAFASQPQYRIRDQLKRDFLEGGLFRDAKQSLGQTKDAFLEDVSSLRNIIGSGINNAKEGIMNSSPMNFFRSLPTPTNLLLNLAATRNPLNPRASNYNPTLQGQIDYMKDKGMYGIIDQSGLNKITGGRLAGKNLVSGFGSNDLGKMYSKDLSKLEGYLKSMPRRFSRLRKNDPFSYNKKIENLQNKIKQNKIEAQAAQAAREAATAARAMARNPEVYRNAGITSGGFASQNTGTNSNFSNRTGRGRTGYSEGGLASMFTRRG